MKGTRRGFERKAISLNLINFEEFCISISFLNYNSLLGYCPPKCHQAPYKRYTHFCRQISLISTDMITFFARRDPLFDKIQYKQRTLILFKEIRNQKSEIRNSSLEEVSCKYPIYYFIRPRAGRGTWPGGRHPGCQRARAFHGVLALYSRPRRRSGRVPPS